MQVCQQETPEFKIMRNKKDNYCAELVYSTELGRKKYLDFIEKSTTSLNMSGSENKLRVPPKQDVKKGGYMYSNRLCIKNRNF
jgi:hypothetical protein